MKFFVSIDAGFTFPISDFDGKISISKTKIPACEVKNMQVNYLSEIDTGTAVSLKDLLNDVENN